MADPDTIDDETLTAIVSMLGSARMDLEMLRSSADRVMRLAEAHPDMADAVEAYRRRTASIDAREAAMAPQLEDVT